MKKFSLLAVLLCGLMLLDLPSVVRSQEREVNYDESKVPEYTLPDPLMTSGAKVKNPDAWVKTRRPEIMSMFREQVYGNAPGRPSDMSFRLVESGDAFDGNALRKQVEITLRNEGKELTIGVLIYIPKSAKRPVPAFMGLNFAGNHTITNDPAVILNTNWMRPNEERGIVDNRATEATRGTSAGRWAKFVIDNGYALVSAYYGDIDPDFHDGFNNGVHALYSETAGEDRPGDAWGSIGAWAWGLSRMMDYLETDDDVDAARVVVMGHSRLGKTSLWAGAQDERFAMVISNNSGCGGAALSRREFGETVKIINTSFPHWFCGNFKKYNERVDELPVDQHMLISLIAPRPVYVASAVEDRWADPRGEFLSLKHAAPVYELLTGESLAVGAMPAVDKPVIGRQAYHIRSGRHNVTDFDWQQYIKWADMFLKGN